MKTVLGLFVCSLLITTAIVTVGPVLAAGDQSSPISGYGFQPSNYCLSCHTSGDSRLEMPTAWIGDIDRELISPCPAATRIHEELYYTERMMLAIDRTRAGLSDSEDLAKVDARVSAAQQTYSRLLDTPVTSVDAFTSEALMLRYRLGKSQTQINQIIDSIKRQRVLLFSFLATLVVLISLVWGYQVVKKRINSSQNGKQKSRIPFSIAYIRLSVSSHIFSTKA